MINRPLSFDNIPLVLTVEELMPILSIGRNTAFALVRSGQSKSIRAGKQIRILKHELLEYLTNLGYATASFTLDVYGHVTDQMKRDSAERMQKFIKSVSG